MGAWGGVVDGVRVGKWVSEGWTGVAGGVGYGSEYRYRRPLVAEGDLAVGISQSGETADTVSAMETARDRGARLLSICNVVGSQTTRMSDGVIYTHAGPEIGVASTKAFTSQLIALYLLALYLRQQVGREMKAELLDDLARLPAAVGEVLTRVDHYDELARRYAEAQIGRAHV